MASHGLKARSSVQRNYYNVIATISLEYIELLGYLHLFSYLWAAVLKIDSIFSQSSPLIFVW
jgi:hypothetical protein